MFRFVNNASVNPVLVPEPEVVLPVRDEPVAVASVPIQENRVSEQSTPSAEEAVKREVYTPSENGDVPVVEVEEDPVAEVDTQLIVEHSAKIEDEPKKKIEEESKKSYASIVSV